MGNDYSEHEIFKDEGDTQPVVNEEKCDCKPNSLEGCVICSPSEPKSEGPEDECDVCNGSMVVMKQGMMVLCEKCQGQFKPIDIPSMMSANGYKRGFEEGVASMQLELEAMRGDRDFYFSACEHLQARVKELEVQLDQITDKKVDEVSCEIELLTEKLSQANERWEKLRKAVKAKIDFSNDAKKCAGYQHVLDCMSELEAQG